jgi:hypothetical protein
LAEEIKETKRILDDLISRNEHNLLEKEVIEVSRRIDALLFRYHNLQQSY